MISIISFMSVATIIGTVIYIAIAKIFDGIEEMLKDKRKRGER